MKCRPNMYKVKEIKTGRSRLKAIGMGRNAYANPNEDQRKIIKGEAPCRN